MRPRQNGCYFADNIFKCIFLNENVRITIKISLKFVPKDPIKNIPALVQIMAWRRPGDKPLSEPMMVSLLTHICVTRPQWVKDKSLFFVTSIKNIDVFDTTKFDLFRIVDVYFLVTRLNNQVFDGQNINTNCSLWYFMNDSQFDFCRWLTQICCAILLITMQIHIWIFIHNPWILYAGN